MNSRTPLLVLGLGNLLLEDDGVGPAALALLAERYEPPVGVQVFDGGTLGLSLLPYVEDAASVILVDAINADEPPGTFVRLDGDEVAPAVATRLSVHQVGVADLLEAARWSDRLPPRLVLLGLVPESMAARRRPLPTRPLLSWGPDGADRGRGRRSGFRVHAEGGTMRVGRRIEARGIVQGVGFRPWVTRVAREQGVAGRVRNDARGVTIDAFADQATLDRFVARLTASPPPAADVREWQSHEIPDEPIDRFDIADTVDDGDLRISIPADLAICDDCLAEIFDPRNRRYRYPFTNCTNCGPRFTIARAAPYDRTATTMDVFEMCARCRREYDDPGNRRFHAQPNACPDCGPGLALLTARGDVAGDPDPIAAAARALSAGLIVAVKGLGGFHLACDAGNARAVRELRARKHRDEKPFAVMVRSLDEAERLAALDADERSLLTSVERPIVLVRRREDCALASEIAPGQSARRPDAAVHAAPSSAAARRRRTAGHDLGQPQR